MTGALCSVAAANLAPLPPLIAGIIFNGSTANAHFNVSNYDGDAFATFGAEFDLSASGGSGAYSHLSYDITANSGAGYVCNTTRALYGQAGTTIETLQTMTMGWGLNENYLNVGDSVSVTVRCKAEDSLGTIVFSNPITVSVTRTS